MKPEYDLSNLKSRPNPFAKQLKQQVTLPLGIEVMEYFEKKAIVKPNNTKMNRLRFRNRLF